MQSLLTIQKSILISQKKNDQQQILFGWSIYEEIIQEKENIEEKKPKGVRNMQAEIIGFEKQIIQMEKEDEKTKETKTVNEPIAIITLRSNLPDMLPVGRIVEITVVKEKKKE